MGASIALKQLFSTEEKCLPNGRQALQFALDFSTQKSFVVGPQSLAGARPFAGIKGLFLQGGENQYVPGDKVTFNPVGESVVQLLVNEKTGVAYWTDGITINAIGPSIIAPVTIAAAPNGSTYIMNRVNNQFSGSNDSFAIGNDGYFYCLSFNSTTGVAYVVKIDPSTGAVANSLALPGTTTSFDYSQIALAMQGNGTFWVAYNQVNGAGPTYNVYVVSIVLSSFTVSGTFTGTTATYSQPTNLILDSAGNVLMFSQPSGAANCELFQVVISSLASGVYSGNSFAMDFALNSGVAWVLANQYGGFVLFNQNVGQYPGSAIRYDAPGYTQAITAQLPTDEPSILIDNFNPTPEKGNASYYVLQFAPYANYPTSFLLSEFDTFTLELKNQSTIPFFQGISSFDTNAAYLDVATGTLYIENVDGNGTAISYTLSSTSELTVTVNGTGQTFTVGLEAGQAIWLPLIALESDTVTFAADSGTVSGFLLNYDVQPFQLS